jgi:hypothetical protein
MRRSITLVLAAALLAYGSGGFFEGRSRAGAQERGSSGGFTTAERARLAQGQLVERRRLERHGAYLYFGGTSFQTIDRPLDEVWRALRDPDHYRDLLPQVERTTIVERGVLSNVLRFDHAVSLVRASYHLRVNRDDARHDLAFELDTTRPNDIRAVRGFCQLAEWPGASPRTLVSWGILASLDDGLASDFLRPQLHDWMLRVPTTMRSFLHGRGRRMFVADSGQRSAHH